MAPHELQNFIGRVYGLTRAATMAVYSSMMAGTVEGNFKTLACGGHAGSGSSSAKGVTIDLCRSASEWHIISEMRMVAASGDPARRRSMSMRNCTPSSRRRFSSDSAPLMTCLVSWQRSFSNRSGSFLAMSTSTSNAGSVLLMVHLVTSK